MAFDEDLIKGMSAIYKYVYENPGVHGDVLRKQMINKGKIASKEKFSRLFESLLSLGKLTMNGEFVSVNPKIISLGILQKNGNESFIVTPNSKKHLPVQKSIASGYSSGDVLDLVVEFSGKDSRVIVIGKSNKKLEPKQKPKPEVKQFSHLNNDNLVLGRVVKLNHDDLVFIPNKKSILTRQIPILNAKDEQSAFQDKICVMNLEDINTPLLGGHIVAVKGDAGNPIHEYDAIAESYGAVMGWDDTIIKSEIAKIPTSVDIDSLSLISEAEADFKQKDAVVDLRNIPFATVDPATCKDMDDAIYSTINEEGDFVCYTAVANVSKYVDLNSEIGRRYVNGAFTIYAPNKAYNILPTELSTGICSLNPDEDRLAFVVKTVIDKTTGKAKESKIYDAVIKSRHKYSYEDAQQIVDYLDVDGAKDYLKYKALVGEELLPEEQILMNYYAAQAIKTGFEQRRMIRFNGNKEREIIFDEDLDDVVDIKIIPHLFYHEVIEAFMITANEATAKFAKDNKLDNIYRVHDEPNPRKLERANEFFDILGIDFDGDLSAQGTRNLIDLIRNSSQEEVVNNFLIKMQSRAIYSDHLYSEKHDEVAEEWSGEQISHFALQSPHYSHTTSPIRRIPDYLTQYNILAKMHGTKPISLGKIQDVVEIANRRQLEVDQAEKDFEDISSVIYCEKHIGEKMTGRITKIRYTSPDEGYEDEIVVIVKNEENGVSAEIPLSQILGRPTLDCSLSEQCCAVYDGRGNIVVTLCKPLEFIIEKADRKTMIVVGRTNKELVKNAELKAKDYRNFNKHHSQPAIEHIEEKNNRDKRFKEKETYRSSQFEKQ